MKKWWSRFTGGRPMSCLVFCFEDVLMNRSVYLWTDHFGRFWLAASAWAAFRVESESPEIWLDDIPEWSIFYKDRVAHGAQGQ